MIETARLLLRWPEPQDFDALHAMWSDAVAMADLGPVRTREGSEAALARHGRYRGEGLGFWSVVERDGGAVVGFCGLKRAGDDVSVPGELEAGWMIARDRWRRGYALEAMRAALDYGWRTTDAPRVVAITAARNVASRAVMERLGMTYQPTLDFLHSGFAPDDPLASAVVYVLPRP